MHAYSISERWRWRVPALAGALGFAFYLGLTSLLPAGWLSLPFLVDVLSPLGIAGFLLFIYDRWLWTYFSRAGLDPTPDFSGEWAGTGYSSYHGTRDDPEGGNQDPEGWTPFECTVKIRQRWSHIVVELDAEESHSISRIAGIRTEAGSRPVLVYEYENHTEVRTPDTMGPHEGVAHLELGPDGDTLEGYYYTGPNRGNVGELSLERTG